MTRKLLLPLDLDHGAVFESVFSEVRDQASIRESAIDVLSVIPQLTLGYFPAIEARYMRKLADETERRLGEIAQEHLGDAFTWRAHVVVGKPSNDIIRFADTHETDLIIMASHNPRTSDILFGSVADRVVRQAHHSVLVVRQRLPAGTAAQEPGSSQMGAGE